MPIFLSRISRGIVPLAVLAVMAVACRRDESTSETPSPAIRKAPPPSAAPPSSDTLQVAVAAMVSPASTFSAYEALLEHIATQVGRPLEFVQRRTYKEVNDLLVGGGVDLAFICSGAFASFEEDAPVELIAIPVVHGRTTYRSYIIVRADSGLEDFPGLKAKQFAFTDPLSNTGYYFPLSHLADLGSTPSIYFGKTMFTGSHDRSITAVFRQLADGAAVDSLVYDHLVTPGSRYEGRLKVILESPDFPIPPVVVPKSLPEELRHQLRDALLALHETEQGRAKLANVGFDRFVPGDPKAYQIIRKMAERVPASATEK